MYASTSAEGDADAESGRGLWLLDLMAKEWGSEHLPDGRLRVHYSLAW